VTTLTPSSSSTIRLLAGADEILLQLLGHESPSSDRPRHRLFFCQSFHAGRRPALATSWAAADPARARSSWAHDVDRSVLARRGRGGGGEGARAARSGRPSAVVTNRFRPPTRRMPVAGVAPVAVALGDLLAPAAPARHQQRLDDAVIDERDPLGRPPPSSVGCRSRRTRGCFVGARPLRIVDDGEPLRRDDRAEPCRRTSSIRPGSTRRPSAAPGWPLRRGLASIRRGELRGPPALRRGTVAAPASTGLGGRRCASRFLASARHLGVHLLERPAAPAMSVAGRNVTDADRPARRRRGRSLSGGAPRCGTVAAARSSVHVFSLVREPAALASRARPVDLPACSPRRKNRGTPADSLDDEILQLGPGRRRWARRRDRSPTGAPAGLGRNRGIFSLSADLQPPSTPSLRREASRARACYSSFRHLPQIAPQRGGSSSLAADPREPASAPRRPPSRKFVFDPRRGCRRAVSTWEDARAGPSCPRTRSSRGAPRNAQVVGSRRVYSAW